MVALSLHQEALRTGVGHVAAVTRISLGDVGHVPAPTKTSPPPRLLR